MSYGSSAVEDQKARKEINAACLTNSVSIRFVRPSVLYVKEAYPKWIELVDPAAVVRPSFVRSALLGVRCPCPSVSRTESTQEPKRCTMHSLTHDALERRWRRKETLSFFSSLSPRVRRKKKEALIEFVRE